MKKLILTILILLFAWPAWAETLYVRPSTGEYGAEDGTSGNEITYNGQGYTILGSKTFGDYSIITRMKN